MMYTGPWFTPPVNTRQVQRAVARAILTAIHKDKTIPIPPTADIQLGLLARAQ